MTEGDRDYPDGRPLARQPQWQQDFATDVPADDQVSRREFTKFLVLTSGAFAVGQCWIAAMSLLRREGPFPERPVAREDEVPRGGVVEFRYPGDDDPCLLLRLADDRLVAYSQKCTHLACAVVPDAERTELHCPCHNGSFEVAGGRPVAGPPRRPLPRVTLAVRGGVVYATGVELRTA
jgi:Rieske Fe-S protein